MFHYQFTLHIFLNRSETDKLVIYILLKETLKKENN